MVFSPFENYSEFSNSEWNPNTIYVGEKPTSLSFSGCGFLGVYHIGVASCIKLHAPAWLKNIDRIYGCSVGSLVGAMLLSDVCFGDVCKRMMNIVKDLRSRYLGPFSPGFKLNEMLLRDIQNGLPPDAHIRASGKLFISLTCVSDGKNVIVSDFKSREELIQVLLSSCFVPFYSGVFPPQYRGVRYVDGGLSNNLPTFHDTITVSPWSGNSDICPRNDESESLLDLNFVNTSIQMTASNLYRISTMFFPPSPDTLKEFCCQGFQETTRYLRDHGLFETLHPLRKNLSFSSLLHKVEERRKLTRRLSFTARRMRKCDRRTSSNTEVISQDFKNKILPDSENLTSDLTTKFSEKCFDEADLNGNLPSLPATKENTKVGNVFTVIQVYPAGVENHAIRLEFQLPLPILDALESSLEQNGKISWLKPFSTFLSIFRHSMVIQVPLVKTYTLACFLLDHSMILPHDLSWLLSHLQQLIDQLHSFFKCSGDILLKKLTMVSLMVHKEIAFLTSELTAVVQIIVKTTISRSIPFYSSLLALRNKYTTSVLQKMQVNGNSTPLVEIV